jgi:alpha-1,3-mannosyl-glycoprotein beta-1,2-N-acetylglucosaminyltransferase
VQGITDIQVLKQTNNVSNCVQDNYDVQFVTQVYESLVVTYQELKSGSIVAEGSVRIPYHTNDMYKRTAKMLGLMDDFRVSTGMQ